MGQIITRADLESHFQEEIDQLGALDPNRVDKLIQAAESEAVTIIGRWPDIIRADALEAVKRHLADIARYLLWDDDPTGNIKERYDEALAFFRAVADGTIQLAETTERQDAKRIAVRARPQVFTDAVMESML